MPDEQISQKPENTSPADTANLVTQNGTGQPIQRTMWGTIKSLLALIFADKTFEATVSDITPAAPANSVNVRWQSAGGSPDTKSAYVSGPEIAPHVPHDQTNGYVASRHVDHSAVAANAGTGINVTGDHVTGHTHSLDPLYIGQFDDDTPAPPASSINVKWQETGAGPTTISAYITAAQIASLGFGGALTQTAAVYVSKAGNDSSDGLSAGSPKLTIGAGITAAAALVTGGAPSAAVIVMDSGEYTENLAVTAGLRLHAPTATLIGTLSLADNSSAKLWAHYNAAGTTTAVTKTGASGRAFYEAEILDTRGTGGALTGNTGIQNATSGGVMFAKVGVLYVSASGFGIQDSGAGFGHLHFWAADLYLAGNSATGIRAQTANSNIIGYIDHILETGSPTTTVGIAVSNASAIVKATITEIIADTVYNISDGSLHLVCSKATGVRTGTPVFEISDQIVKATAAVPALYSFFIPCSAMVPPVTSPPASVDFEGGTEGLNAKCYDFDAASVELLTFMMAVPNDLFSFTTYKFQPVWTTATTPGTGNVVWQSSAVAIANDEAFDAATGTIQTSTDAYIATGDTHVGPESAAITPAGGSIATADLLYFTFGRYGSDVSDTYDQDARLIGVIVTFQ